MAPVCHDMLSPACVARGLSPMGDKRHLFFPCSLGVCAASVKSNSEWNGWAVKDENPLMERRNMENVISRGSCFIGRRVNRKEDCILPYEAHSSGLSIPCYHFRKTEALLFFTFIASEEFWSVLESIHKTLQRFPSSRVQMVQSKYCFFLYDFWNACSGEYCVEFIYIYIKEHSIYIKMEM